MSSVERPDPAPRPAGLRIINKGQVVRTINNPGDDRNVVGAARGAAVSSAAVRGTEHSRQAPRDEQLRKEIADAGLSLQPTTSQELGALLKYLRTTANVSQPDLGSECLINESYVRHAEHGRQMPRRRFWAEADIALAADGVLTQAYDTWAEPQNAPRPGMRVLATAARARNDARWRAAVTDCGIDPHRSYSRSNGPVRAQRGVERAR